MKSDIKILIAFFLNISFSIIEMFGGMFTNSVAVMSDAVHDFGDAVSIGISYFLERVSKKNPDSKYTYGYVRYSILGALITNIILIIGSILVSINAVNKFINPFVINYNGMILFAVFGVIVIFLAVYFTKEANSLNQKAVNLHMLEDILGWLVVLFGAVIIKFTGINRIDAILSISVAIFILINAVRGLNKIVDLFLEKTPDNINLDEIKASLLEIKGVSDIHHIHVWSIDGFNNYATMHVVCKNKDYDKLKLVIKENLKDHNISHSTIEMESIDYECCDVDCLIEHNIESSHHHHH